MVTAFSAVFFPMLVYFNASPSSPAWPSVLFINLVCHSFVKAFNAADPNAVLKDIMILCPNSANRTLVKALIGFSQNLVPISVMTFY